MPRYMNAPEAQDRTVSEGWKPAAVKKVAYQAIKTGDNAGKPRLSILYSITNGTFEGENVFGGGNLVGAAAKFTRRELQAVAPDVNWGEYDFPELGDKDGADQLNEDLVGREVFIYIKHRQYNGETQASVARVAPESADIEIVDDDEEDEAA